MATKAPKRITSIKEIAKLADCSIATVSNTLNNKGRISQEVRDKIFEICSKHGYLPNSAGRNLRLQKNETVGLLFYPSCASIFRNIFYAEVMEALEMEMEKHGYDILLSGYDSSMPTKEPPRFVRQGKVDGLIMLGRFPRAEVKRIKDFGVPLLHLDGHRENIKVDYVTTDGYGACSQIVDELVSLGHRRIVFMAFDHEDTNADQREAGFLAAVAKHELPKTLSVSLRDFETTAEGYESLKPLLKSKRPPTAIVAVNDTLAVEIQEFLQADGYSIPNDLSIFGFNDDKDSRKANPQISTVRIDKERLGRTGADMIINRINHRDTKHQSNSLPFELILRGSIGAPPA